VSQFVGVRIGGGRVEVAQQFDLIREGQRARTFVRRGDE
jgi:hypothetical protein